VLVTAGEPGQLTLGALGSNQTPQPKPGASTISNQARPTPESSRLVHLDVDVLHTGLFPLADFPHFAGLTLEQVSVSLEVFAAGETLGGLVITEVNPDHDPSGDLLATLAKTVAGSLGC
jgi:arginase family enzyme